MAINAYLQRTRVLRRHAPQRPGHANAPGIVSAPWIEVEAKAKEEAIALLQSRWLDNLPGMKA